MHKVRIGRIGVSLLILIQVRIYRMGLLFLILSQIQIYWRLKSGINQKLENKLNKHCNLFGKQSKRVVF